MSRLLPCLACAVHLCCCPAVCASNSNWAAALGQACLQALHSMRRGPVPHTKARLCSKHASWRQDGQAQGEP